MTVPRSVPSSYALTATTTRKTAKARASQNDGICICEENGYLLVLMQSKKKRFEGTNKYLRLNGSSFEVGKKRTRLSIRLQGSESGLPLVLDV
jgi:hypothetical protein